MELDSLALEDFLHQANPLFVDAFELFPFLVALFFDLLRRGKDVFKVKPVTLEDLPLLNRVTNENQHVVSLLNALAQSFNVA